jgi:hypothetical protein
MLTIDIDRVTARYRLPLSAAAERPRLQRIVDDALTRVLEHALEGAAIDPEAFVCIDTVRMVVPVRLREEDGALTGAVGHAIAAAIQDAITNGPASVVRYGSKAHALADMAVGALAGDFTRSWAWTQIGIWKSDAALRADVAAILVLRTLANEPKYAVGVLAYLARAHADRLRALAVRAAPRAWELLAQSMLSAARGETSGFASRRTPSADRGVAVMSAGAIAHIARHVAAQSAIVRASAGVWPGLATPTRAAIAAVALLEVEPARAQEATLAAEVLAAIEVGTHENAAPRDGLRLRDSSGEPAIASRERSHSPGVFKPIKTAPLAPDSATAGASTIETSSARAPSASPPIGDSIALESGAPPFEAIDVRQHARTRLGGLLYLVNLVAQAGVIRAIEGDERWASRGIRWVLHQCALALVQLEPNDPAALAFAGLPPDAAPPSTDQEPPTDAERTAIHAIAATLAAALRERLGRSAGTDGQSDTALVQEICARPAEIIGEPAWIEARFAIEDVSIDIRRAGLDVNPEWVPWLGLVMRFAYA